MATYAIGDIQGCLASFQKLLRQIAFDPDTDRLWLVGDLVNRGPDSLGVLRFVKSLGPSCVTVLGNHDLHLLAIHAGIASLHKKDTLQPILDAPDCEELLHWLRHQPLLHRESLYVLVHAGILPQWSIEQAMELAHEVEGALRSDFYQDPLAALYRSRVCKWREDLSIYERLGFTTNVLTRMRVCSSKGRIDLSFKGEPKYSPTGFSPWYLLPPDCPRTETIIFGHWSALGELVHEKHIGIDGGCIWGKELMAFCLDDRSIYRVACSS
ncbi:symmetrical bis(5'-nucleosyl)-tetraphosphatase [Candidatus Nitronereus thalassa]|uniref:bis(5'-nucleosyl)-tetraphosphatase (symmetrical) n=1 Tax=Candidatus Nitronereus thalassa TaxID=3020898 RepID=A0ABU3K9S7_9BACT|nr:symmetrical bis(5'-nucleosyl)-tetraphosphatase [Candidatus Nitronereus thalassa]MDT7043048.1 symmetrical bis(5'-nucleosyl)-tetraphosphatase [Candidatus Nitronereus thalassa]